MELSFGGLLRREPRISADSSRELPTVTAKHPQLPAYKPQEQPKREPQPLWHHIPRLQVPPARTPRTYQVRARSFFHFPSFVGGVCLRRPERPTPSFKTAGPSAGPYPDSQRLQPLETVGLGASAYICVLLHVSLVENGPLSALTSRLLTYTYTAQVQRNQESKHTSNTLIETT